jgi:hypothetical protein
VVCVTRALIQGDEQERVAAGGFPLNGWLGKWKVEARAKFNDCANCCRRCMVFAVKRENNEFLGVCIAGFIYSVCLPAQGHHAVIHFQGLFSVQIVSLKLG